MASAEDSCVANGPARYNYSTDGYLAVVDLSYYYTASVPQQHTEIANKMSAVDKLAGSATVVDKAAAVVSIVDFLH